MLNILHVEDNLIDQMAFSRLLKKEQINCKLEVAETIHAAKVLLSQNNFQIMICDLNLPDGSAFELSEYFSDINSIIYSGLIDDEIKAKAKQLGVLDVLPKSSDLKDLKQILKLFEIELSSTPPCLSNQIEEKPKSKEINATLDHLKSVFGNDKNYIADLIQVFLEENPKQLIKLKLAGTENDRDGVNNAAHQLKSGYMLMSLTKLKNMAAELEENPPRDQEALQQNIRLLSDLSFKTYDMLKETLLEMDFQE